MASFKLVYLFLLVSFIHFITIKAQDGSSGTSGYLCPPESLTTPNSPFQSNIRTLLSYLSSNARAANKQFYNTTVASKNHSDTVYGMFVCWGDVPPQLCSQCVANAIDDILSDRLPNCSLSKDAWIDEGYCMIRFSNHSFFSIVDSNSTSGSCEPSNISNQTNVKSLFSKIINEAADEAANSPIGAKKYATRPARISGFQTFYCETQCTPDLSPQDCRKCLNVSITSAQQLCEGGSLKGEYDTRSCNIRYNVYPFYRPSTAPPPKALIPVTNSSNTYSQDPSYLSHNCSTIITSNTTFQSNLKALLSSLSSNSLTKSGFFNNTVDTVSGLFLCRGDLSPALCQQCVLNAIQRISSECPSSKEAIIWYDNCLLRYSDRQSLSTIFDTSPSYHDLPVVNTSHPNLQQSFFTWTLADTLLKLVHMETAKGDVMNYGTKWAKLNDNQTLYTLAQCTQDVDNGDCRSCLQNIFENEIPWCCLESPEGKVLYPSCYMMFGLSQFYSVGDQVEMHRPASPTTANKKVRSETIILIVVSIVISATLFSFCCYLRRRKARKRSHKTLLRKNFGLESTTLEGLQFDLTSIKAATNNFSHENKIGKGGFGVVYKGILSDGRHIAVKRLSIRSKQGSVEFKNEILLIAKLQHRNLVAFIGFCLEEQEKILIYEYMLNGSLDYLLFGTQQQKLSWSQRYEIIRGTALGILYLHEYSRLKVIHRDLKPNNILLDENMNPKISDFGMARIVEIDQDHGNTNRIAGTYGYMSPEYAMLGQFSEKSDVFSFGVMVLEIITGKRNVNSYESYNVDEGLMSYVWRQWKDQTPLSILVDSNIEECYSEMEVLKCIHIGLLSVQKDPNVRPTMATVISYLNGRSQELPSPQEPAFSLDKLRMDQEIVTKQELSTNDMSVTNFYPR